MRGHGYDPDPMWKPFIEEGCEVARGSDMKNLVQQNAPGIVFRQVGLILIIALGFALAVNLLLFAFNIG